MATDAFTSAGTILSISASLPATEDQEGFEALSYTEIEEVVDIGEFGRTYSKVEHKKIADRKTYKFKGSYDDGALNVQLARVPTATGQAICVAALDSDNNYSFKVALPDGSYQYFLAKVFSYTTNVGGVDSIMSAAMQIEIDGSIVEVAAGGS